MKEESTLSSLKASNDQIAASSVLDIQTKIYGDVKDK